MKKKLLFFGLLTIFVFSSCSTVMTFFPSKKGWISVSEEQLLEWKHTDTVRIGKISVDTVSAWDSLEKEIAGLLPLLLLEKGYRSSEEAKFFVEAFLIEREYMEGWQAKRSLIAEIRLWDDKTVNGSETQRLPIAAGRAVLSGGKSLSSSEIMERLLSGALSEALFKLNMKKDLK
jgi:hypothetical protein